MQPRLFCMLHGTDKHLVSEKRTALNGAVNLFVHLPDNPSGSQMQMTYLGVALAAFRQHNRSPMGLVQGVRIFFPVEVHVGRFGLGNIVSLAGFRNPTAIVNDKDNFPQPITCRDHNPANLAFFPSDSSMRSSRLYLAVLSERAGAPNLLWPASNPTTRSAMNASSVSPERWDTTTSHLFLEASLAASMDSVIVPI